MTPQTLQRLCRKWRKRLGLLDWRIGIEFRPNAELEDGSWANVWWSPDDMTATVWMTRPEDIEGQCANFIERCLVHELLHLVLGGHRPCAGYDVNEERAINRLRDALIKEKK